MRIVVTAFEPFGGFDTNSSYLALERLKLAVNDINERISIPIRKAIITIPSIDAEYNLVRANTPVASEEKIVTNKEIITVQNKVIKAYVDSKAVDTSSFLPRSAGVNYPLTGPLGLTKDVMYGPTLPSANTFNG